MQAVNVNDGGIIRAAVKSLSFLMDLDLASTCVRFRYGGFTDNFGSLINPGAGPDTRAASCYRPEVAKRAALDTLQRCPVK